MIGVEIVGNQGDTLRVRMLYLGPPSDGRRCEFRFEISGMADYRAAVRGDRAAQARIAETSRALEAIQPE